VFPFSALLAVAAGLSVIYLFVHLAAQARSRAWRSAAHAAGLSEVVTSDFLGIETGLTGRSGMLRVSLERYHRGKHEKGTRIVIDGLGHPSYEFALRKEGVGSAIEKAFGEREIELGDGEFDRRAYIHGSPRVVHAILDSATRELVGELIDGRIPTGDSGKALKARVSVSDGALRAEIPEKPFAPGGERLPGALLTLLDAARRLRLPDSVPDRLAENVRRDSLAEVRLSNLLTLTREYPGHEITKETQRAACDDADAEVRLRAATELGEEGHQTLRALASSVEVADECSARAVAALKEGLPREEAVETLEKALEARRLETARAVVRALGSIGGKEVVDPLAAGLEDADVRVVVAAAEALGATGASAAELPLIAALGREEPAVWPAVASALGRVGTAEAVAPLRTMAGRFPFDLAVRRAARQAIAEIQSRLTGATPGQLALADGETGQLSLSEEQGEGRVSLAGEELIDAGKPSKGEEEWPTDAKASVATVAEGEAESGPARPRPPKREAE
jgi:hypothetical protein